MNDENLRIKVKLLKALQGVSYKEIAELLNIKTTSLYCWLKGYYSFSVERKQDLLGIIDAIGMPAEI